MRHSSCLARQNLPLTLHLLWLLAIDIAAGARRQIASHLPKGRPRRGLYRTEKNVGDACAIGGIVSFQGRSYGTTCQSLELVSGMKHRGGSTKHLGAKPAPENGDGAGMLSDIPVEIYQPRLAEAGIELEHPDDLAVGMFYMPTKKFHRNRCRTAVERAVQGVFGKTVEMTWRDVPVDTSVVGPRALALMPVIQQLLVKRPADVALEDFEARLFLVKKSAIFKVEALKERQGKKPYELFYICTFSHQRIVHKGMLTGAQLGQFFLDLKDERFKTSKVIVHERFATNTSSAWRLAQPFGVMCHNGEINTLRKNVDYMRALEEALAQKFGSDFDGVLRPFVDDTLSDSGILNDALELLIFQGEMPLPMIMAMVMPSAWENNKEITEEERAFWRWLATIMPGWDGPAAVFFHTGRYLGARLDRCGYRPLRWAQSKEMVVFASEAKVIRQLGITKSRRLGPGQMLVIDTEKNYVQTPSEIMRAIAAAKPFGDFVSHIRACPLPEDNADPSVLALDEAEPVMVRALRAGWTKDEIDHFLVPMAVNGGDPHGSMGDDAQLACLRSLRDNPTPLFHFVQERFAQVTNPALDFLRERVTSLLVYLGELGSPLEGPQKADANGLFFEAPVLSAERLKWYEQQFAPAVIDVSYKDISLKEALAWICDQVDVAIDEGKTTFVLSDRNRKAGTRLIPMFAAVSTIDLHLTNTGRRNKFQIIADTREVRLPHDLAVLLGYGAHAVCPRAVWELLAYLCEHAPSDVDAKSYAECVANYLKAMKYGLLKVMAKMGIATVASFGRNFESFGLHEDFASEVLGEDPEDAPISGLGYDEIQQIYDRFGELADELLECGLPEEELELPSLGRFQTTRGGTPRGLGGALVAAIHSARDGLKKEPWERVRTLANEREEELQIRDLLDFKKANPLGSLAKALLPGRKQMPLRDVFRRIRTSPMSYGSISGPSHEDLALAAWALGFLSGSGEGGEDPRRYLRPEFLNGHTTPGAPLLSRLKQIASGRFGVTLEYLLSASVIEIKIAQGAKAGEGGALHWKKVKAMISFLRGTNPHVQLTSPPPHHDIYSIEDLKQLIRDLKCVNPLAQICVKLVPSRGIGNVAVGVAKAGADMIQIAGHCGGTGNAPVNSINFTGLPWEVGLSWVHQALLAAGLREQVILGVDGGLVTGRDVVVAALLGAEIFGFGTSQLISLGCVMNRKCHLNNCPVGIATTDPRFVGTYTGKAEYVMNSFAALGLEIRDLLESLGLAHLDDAVGRTDLLKRSDRGPEYIKLDKVLFRPEPRWRLKRETDFGSQRNGLCPVETPIDDMLCDMPEVESLIETGEGHVSISGERAIKISSCDLSVGTRLAHKIGLKHPKGFKNGSLYVEFEGAGGQSFGAWLPKGVAFKLVGEVQDGIAKGLSGGEIVVVPHEDVLYNPEHGTIGGNAIAYGANSGTAYFYGNVGERFGVLNKGATLVSEGAGMHFCEYMTGGFAIALGAVGRNAFAGMSGGVGFVHDPSDSFADRRCNSESVDARRLSEADSEHVARLKTVIEDYLEKTGSTKAQMILEHWERELGNFWIALPRVDDAEQARMQEEARSEYEALIESAEDVEDFFATRREKIERAAEYGSRILEEELVLS